MASSINLQNKEGIQKESSTKIQPSKRVLRSHQSQHPYKEQRVTEVPWLGKKQRSQIRVHKENYTRTPELAEERFRGII